MSVHTIPAAKSETFEVRWRDVHGAQRSKRCETQADADAFDVAVRARVALDRAEARWQSVPARLRREVAAA